MSTFPAYLAKPIPGSAQVALSVGGTAVALTVPAGAKFAVITVETEPVRWRDDGSAPTAADGMYLPETTGDPFIYPVPAGLSTIEFIATTGTAILNVSYYE